MIPIKNVLALARWHSEGDETKYKEEVQAIARLLDEQGEFQSAEYLLALITPELQWTPQKEEADSLKIQGLTKRVEALERWSEEQKQSEIENALGGLDAEQEQERQAIRKELWDSVW